ncbi:Similar to Atg12: Ubiquitin-like protein ATG12 (Rattus norvegicus) [Cotesia congregata]|uniref:Ubiquitin-like protein ATG12 n=1 Tax=Cotesia congregata TaxID=51543 RepID=A0A8J2MLC1_COTCN|nr:Similar to Atg12: Ubiquitin-like protein ATG12 (Rattus norvegicus) [Cotesia congregata]
MGDKEEEIPSQETSENAGDNASNNKPAAEEAEMESLKQTLSDTNLSGADGSQSAPKDKTKIDILLKATGNAPIMKKKKWAFLYINQTFAPAPDQTVKNLYDCYGTDGKLIIHYCKSQAWG